MADRTGIEWTDATWPVTYGCSLASPGCAGCYAMPMAARLERMGNVNYAGLTAPSKAGPVWTGEVREADFGEVPAPLRWKKPRMIFVNSMSDLFNPNVSSDHIAHVFGIMACAAQHTFQVLTKRPDRMAELLNTEPFWTEVWSYAADYAHLVRDTSAYAEAGVGALKKLLPNVWLGTSVEDQRRADERLPDLRATPAALRFVSFEPLLELVVVDLAGIGWAICGGESGPGARPMNPKWPRSLRDQCWQAGVPFFFKQWSEWVYAGYYGEPLIHQDRPVHTWPAIDLMHGIKAVPQSIRVGKRAAGALLDGREHKEFPHAPL